MFIEFASCTLTAQVLKEYEKTISELIADKERDKKALEAEVRLFSLTMDFRFHGNLAFTCFFNRCRRCSRRRSRQWKIFRWTKTLASLGKKIGAAGHLCVFSLITVNFFCRMWRRPLQTFTENMSEPSRSRGIEIFLGLCFITIFRW